MRLLGVYILVAFSINLMPAKADEVQNAVYQGYFAGFNVLEMRAQFGLDGAGYQFQVRWHTTGATPIFVVDSKILLHAEGFWGPDRPLPKRSELLGSYDSKPTHILIEYEEDGPVVRDLLPPEMVDRDPLPPTERAQSLDPLAALAFLMRRAGLTGRCDGSTYVYDGHTLDRMTARTARFDKVPWRVAAYVDPLYCELEFRQAGGFASGDDRKKQSQPRCGFVWLASLGNDGRGLKLPVWVQIEAGWLGPANLYLTEIQP